MNLLKILAANAMQNLASPLVGFATAIPSSNTITFASGAVAGAQAGDLALLVMFEPDGGRTTPTPAGWSLGESGGGSGVSRALFYKTLTSSDVSASFSSGDSDGAAILMVFRGFTYTENARQFDNNTITPPDLLMSSGDVSVIAGGQEDTRTPTAPAGYTFIGSRSNGTNTASAVVAAFKRIVTTGTERPGRFGNSGGENSDCYTIRLSPI